MSTISILKTSVTIILVNENDYINLTDIAKYKSDDPTAVIGNWLRNRKDIEYLGIRGISTRTEPQPLLPQIVNRIPGGEEADGEDCNQNHKDVAGFDADGIGVDDKGAGCLA